MDADSSLPSVPENSSEIYSAMNRALSGINLTQNEREAISTYIGREVKVMLNTAVTSYLVLGSYREDYHERLRIVEHELTNRRTDTSAVVLGDTAELGVSERDLPTFSIKFNLLATASDYIVMVIEKEDGGEGVELGRIAEPPYFQDSHVLPRDYANFVSDSISSLEDGKKAALEVWFNNKLSLEEKINEISGIASEVPKNSIEESNKDEIEGMLKDYVEERETDDNPPATYSWVHLSDFRKFERVGRCYPWNTKSTLRSKTQKVPGPATSDISSNSAQ